MLRLSKLLHWGIWDTPYQVLIIYRVSLSCYCIFCYQKCVYQPSQPWTVKVTLHQPLAWILPLITVHNAQINKCLTFAPHPVTQYPRLSTCLINIHIPKGQSEISLLHHPSHIMLIPLGPLGRGYCLLPDPFLSPGLHMVVPNHLHLLAGKQDIDPPMPKRSRNPSFSASHSCYGVQEQVGSSRVLLLQVLLHRSREIYSFLCFVLGF